MHLYFLVYLIFVEGLVYICIITLIYLYSVYLLALMGFCLNIV